MRAPIQTVYVLMFFLVGCNASSPPVIEEAYVKPAGGQFITEAGHSPPFAQMSYEAFSRADTVGIAEQEWRLFGERVDDDPPPPGGFSPVPGDDPARAPGQWERIGEYWWLGQAADRREAAWTGMHDENAKEIDESRVDYSRERHKLAYEKLPRQRFAAHCDIVVAQENRQISVIGGNVDHAVTMKHVPVTTDGRLADRGDHVLDARYPWLVVLRILYDR